MARRRRPGLGSLPGVRVPSAGRSGYREARWATARRSTASALSTRSARWVRCLGRRPRQPGGHRPGATSLDRRAEPAASPLTVRSGIRGFRIPGWSPLRRVPPPGDGGRSRRPELTGPFERREWVPRQVVALTGRARSEPLDGDVGDDEISGALVAPEVACDMRTPHQCCGNLGTTALLGRWASSAAGRRPRISHTGGHRFAPTSSPAATCMWSHLAEAGPSARVDLQPSPSTAAARRSGVRPSDRGAGLIEVGWVGLCRVPARSVRPPPWPPP